MNSRNEGQRDVQAESPVQSPATARRADVPGDRVSRAIQGIVVDRSIRESLVNQIVEQVRGLLAKEALRPMDKLPSVRALARQIGVSAFTMVEAYDRLVSGGQLVSRPGAGYFVAPIRPGHRPITRPQQPQRPSASVDASGPFDCALAADEAAVPLGGSSLPPEWHDVQWMRECARTALRSGAALVRGQEHILGNTDLRRHLSRCMAHKSVEADEDQVLLTSSGMHALDLVLGALTRPGDAVVVEDPTHPGLSALVARHGCVALPVRRSGAGLDLDSLSEIALRRAPRLAIVTTVLHNPLGTTLTARQAHDLLALAEQFDFLLVEDDVFRDIADAKAPSLAALDGLRRVIRIDSTSKLMPSLARFGAVAAAAPLVSRLAHLKQISGAAGAVFSERVALHALTSSQHRRHIARLQARLEHARAIALDLLPELGLVPLAVPDGGMFLSASAGDHVNVTRALQVAREHRVLLSPGTRFASGPAERAWFRLNLAYAGHPAVRDVFTTLAREAPNNPGPSRSST